MTHNSSPKRMSRFLTIWAGQLVSTLGSGLTGFGVGVWLYQETGSTTLFALNLLAFMLPNVLLSPIIGALVDRYNRRTVMMLSDTLAGLSSLTLGVLFFTGRLEVWHVYALTFCNAAATAFQWPAYSAATSQIVPKDKLDRASGMVQMGEALGHLISPAIAGALFYRAGLGALLLIDFATFLFAVVTLLLTRIPDPERSEAGQQAATGNLLREGLYGWHYIMARPGLLGLLLYFAAWNLFWGIASVMILPLAMNLATADVVGYVSSAVGIGMLVGTLAVSVWGTPKRRVYGIMAAGFISSLSVIVMGLRPSLWLLGLGGAGVMLSIPFGGASSQAIWQVKVPQDVQGRVFASRRMIAWSSTLIAYPLAGPLADRVFEPLMQPGGALAPLLGPIFGVGPGRGMGLLMSLMGLLLGVSALAVSLYPRTRRVELEIPDAVKDEPAAVESVEGQMEPAAQTAG